MEVADEDMGMLPIYIGAKGEEEQGLCTGSENYWCVNKNASEEDIQATLDFLQWIVESDEGRDMLANTMGFVTPFTTFEDYLPSNPLVQANEEENLLELYDPDSLDLTATLSLMRQTVMSRITIRLIRIW